MSIRLSIGVLSSHEGTNLQTIIDACKEGRLDAQVRVVVCNNSSAMAIERARREGIPFRHISGRTHPEPHELDAAIASALEEHGVELVVLAGYMKKLGPRTLDRYPRRVLNIHPALLAGFGGEGMYGSRVHKAVLESGDALSGVTVHLVDEEYDHGPIVAQRKVRVLDDDTPESLASRVLEQEHAIYPETLQMIATGEIDLDRPNPMPELRRYLKAIRTISLAEAAKRSGISRSWISDFEKGVRNPNPGHLVSLARAYQVDRKILLLYADFLHLPGFDPLILEEEEVDGLARLLQGANLKEEHELANHLATIPMISKE
jgi:phosphoribosylglycinamide formyltransferase-1